MKKSVLNTSIHIILSSALLSAAVLTTKAHANELIPDDNINSNDNTTETYMLHGLGAGAAAGAVVAGPVGLLFGGLIGAFVGENQQVVDNSNNTLFSETSSNTTETPVTKKSDNETTDTSLAIVHVAQLDQITPIINDDVIQDSLIEILSTDLSLDVYFRSGSTDIESFYSARLVAVADLINNIDELNIHLDGYTDRRGNKEQNIILANQRLDNVRQQLINAGIEKNRIISKAFGEMKMVSTAGDLDGYTFDRKVVIRFEQSNQDFQPEATPSVETALSDDKKSDPEKTDAVVADVSTPF